MDTLLLDLRYALRGLARTPGFTLAAVLTLGLGIGANTAIFSVVNGVLLEPLPYEKPEQLVSVSETNLGKGFTTFSVSAANYLDFRDESVDLLSGLAAYDNGPTTLFERGEATRLRLANVTSDLFGVLGTVPFLGRGFDAGESQRGRHQVAVLSHALWASRFGADRGVLGRSILLDGEPYQVVGILPPSFSFPLKPCDLFVPYVYPKDIAKQRGAHYLRLVGRRRPGVAIATVRTRLETVAARLAATFPGSNKGWSVSVEDLRERIVGSVRPALLVLLGAVGLVTLISCVNVASLLLARAAAREADVAVRLALGAARTRLVRQLLTEAVVVAAGGFALALVLGVWGVAGLRAFGPADVPRLASVTLDGRVMLFTGALALLTSLLFGLFPALQASRPDLIEALKGKGRGVANRRETSLRAVLVTGEIALTLTLLVGAGLLLRSFQGLMRVDAGITSENVLTFGLSLPESRYGDGQKLPAFYARLLERLDALPGVRSTGAIMGLPLSGFGFSTSFSVEGTNVPIEDQPSGQLRFVAGRYFETLGVPIRSGRGFTSADRHGAPKVALASERAVKLFFPAGDAIGKRITFGAHSGPDSVGGEIVGIVADVKDRGLDVDATPLFYLPSEQAVTSDMTLVLKTTVPPMTLADAVRREVAALDPELPVAELATLDEVLQKSVARPRFYALLLGSFAVVALLLSAVGLYGVVSYGVARRSREIGVRVALGARSADIVSLVLRQGARLTGAGLALGLLLSLLTTRLLGTLLFGVSPTDGASFVSVGLLLLSVALLACYLPARRASRVDPVIALRCD